MPAILQQNGAQHHGRGTTIAAPGSSDCSVTVTLRKDVASVMENVAREVFKQLRIGDARLAKLSARLGPGKNIIAEAASFMRSRGEVPRLVREAKGVNVTLSLSVPGWVFDELGIKAPVQGTGWKAGGKNASTVTGSGAIGAGASGTGAGGGEVESAEVAFAREAWENVESTAYSFGERAIREPKVRQYYREQAAHLAQHEADLVRRGVYTPEESARRAYRMRNAIMEAARMRSSDIGRAIAEHLKPTPRPFWWFEDYYAGKLFKKKFERLTQAERGKVWMRIVEGSGSPRGSVNRGAKWTGRLSKGLLVLTAAIAIYNIATAENKVAAAKRETAVLGGGMIGAYIGGAVGSLCGPGAVVCVPLGIFVGGVIGAWVAESAYDYAESSPAPALLR